MICVGPILVICTRHSLYGGSPSRGTPPTLSMEPVPRPADCQHSSCCHLSARRLNSSALHRQSQSAGRHGWQAGQRQRKGTGRVPDCHPARHGMCSARAVCCSTTQAAVAMRQPLPNRHLHWWRSPLQLRPKASSDCPRWVPPRLHHER